MGLVIVMPCLCARQAQELGRSNGCKTSCAYAPARKGVAGRLPAQRNKGPCAYNAPLLHIVRACLAPPSLRYRIFLCSTAPKPGGAAPPAVQVQKHTQMTGSAAATLDVDMELLRRRPLSCTTCTCVCYITCSSASASRVDQTGDAPI
eukprot:355814-Chlamydomonas_euryale.AAC.6